MNSNPSPRDNNGSFSRDSGNSNSNSMSNSTSNSRGDGWRGSGLNLSSDLVCQSTVSGSVLAARTAIDNVLRYDKSVFLSVHGVVKKSPQYQSAPEILK